MHEELRRESVEAVLAARESTIRVEQIRPLAGGEISAVYELICRDPDESLVLKIYPDKWHFKMEKEIFVYGLMADDEEIPTPRIVIADDSKRHLNQNGLIMTKLEGRPLISIHERSAKDNRRLYEQLGRVMRRIHAIELNAFGYVTTQVIAPHPTNREYMSFQFEKKLREFGEFGGDPDTAQAIAAHVEANRHLFDDCDAPVLCHDDYHEGNFIVTQDADGVTLSGVVDVENAVAGDPLLDIAKADLYAIGGDPAKWEGFIDGYGPLGVNWQARLRLYKLYHGLELWDWYASVGQHGRLGDASNILDDVIGSAR
jgi:aminoglycoside phosphotransferase (APT) family kinase protein